MTTKSVSKQLGDTLTRFEIYSYATGHFFNDLCSTIWFFYMSYFLSEIVQLPLYAAGTVLLVGQISDAIATLKVGYLIDKTDTSYGKITPWYFTASLLQLVTFYFLLQPSPCESTLFSIIYFSFLGGFFNITWATINVAHYSLPPMLSFNTKITDVMVRLRTGFVFLAQFCALLLSFLCSYFIQDKFTQFKIIDFTIITIGVLFSAFFLYNINEKQRLQDRTALQAQLSDNFPISNNFYKWFGKIEYWRDLCIFVLSKMIVNISGVLLPYYLDRCYGFSKDVSGALPFKIAIVVIFLNFGSILGSYLLQSDLMNVIPKGLFKKAAFVIALLLILAGNGSLYFLHGSKSNLIFVFIFLSGVGFSFITCLSGCNINDLVGKDCSSGFVYGTFSGLEKVANGILIFYLLLKIEDFDLLLTIAISVLPCFLMVVATLLSLVRKGKPEKTQNLSEPFLLHSDSSMESFSDKLN